MKDLRRLFFIGATLFTTLVNGQTDTVYLNKISEHQYNFFYSAYTAIFDEGGAPYLYTASMELGLVTYDISDIMNPTPIDTIMPAMLNGLKLTNIYQLGDYLYGSLGSFQGITEDAGMVIFDVSVPNTPVITDVWDSVAYSEGSAIAISDGQYAYLGAMTEGLIILDVSNVNNIQYKSEILPFVNFPEIPGPLSIPNARGMELKNADTLILCNDAGGLRMIDVTDKNNPLEIGMYAQTTIEADAQSAFNNVVLIGNYAYVPVDYCGLIVVDISDPVMQDIDWENPWDCGNIPWQDAPGHSNQLVNVGDSLIFMSGGDSEILVFDITVKTNPVLVGKFAFPYNMEVAWGIEVNDNYVVTSMVNNPSGWGYAADWGGIQIFEWDAVSYATISESEENNEVIIYPNPTNDFFKMESATETDFISITDLSGKIIFAGNYSSEGISVSEFVPGIYFVEIFSEDQPLVSKLIVE